MCVFASRSNAFNDTSPTALCARMPEQSINKYVWQWGVTISKNHTRQHDRFSASKIVCVCVSDGHSMSAQKCQPRCLHRRDATSYYMRCQPYQSAACAEFLRKNSHTHRKKGLIWTFVYDIVSVCVFFFKLHLQIFHHNIPLSGILGQSEIERENEKKPKLSPSFRIRLNKTNNAIALRCCFFRFACVTWIGLCKTFHSLIVSLFFGWFTAAFMCSTFFLANSILREGKTNKFQNCF